MQMAAKIKKHYIDKRERLLLARAQKLDEINKELFEIYYKQYEYYRLKDYDTNELTEGQNELVEMDAYYAWCDEIMNSQKLTRKLDICKALFKSGCVVGTITLTTIACMETNLLPVNPIIVAITAVLLACTGYQSIETRYETETDSTTPYRSDYFNQKMNTANPDDVRAAYRQSVTDRFVQEHMTAPTLRYR